MAVVLPSVEDILDRQSDALEAALTGRAEREHFALTVKDCVAFAELVNGSLEALGDVDHAYLCVEITPTDTRPVEIRREEAGVDEGEPSGLDTSLPMVRLVFGQLVPAIGTPNQVAVAVTDGDDAHDLGLSTELDSANVFYLTHANDVADELRSLGWDVDDDRDDGGALVCRPPTWVWQRAYAPTDQRDNPRRPTQIQTLIFDDDVFTANKAKAWAKKRKFVADKVDSEKNTHRVRQKPPTSFVKGTFRTIKMTDGVKAVIGVPKER